MVKAYDSIRKYTTNMRACDTDQTCPLAVPGHLRPTVCPHPHRRDHLQRRHQNVVTRTASPERHHQSGEQPLAGRSLPHGPGRSRSPKRPGRHQTCHRPPRTKTGDKQLPGRSSPSSQPARLTGASTGSKRSPPRSGNTTLSAPSTSASRA